MLKKKCFGTIKIEECVFDYIKTKLGIFEKKTLFYLQNKITHLVLCKRLHDG